MEKEREIRLRQRIEELVRSRVGTLEQDISRLQREINQSFTQLLERTDTAANMPEGDESLAQIAADVTAQVDQATAESVRLGADIALLRDSVAELNEQHTQAEVLNALVARAANFAPRVVLFVVKGTNALAWAARGLDDTIGNQSIRGLTVSLQSDTVLRGALNAQQTFYGSPDQQGENALIFSRLGNLRPQRVLGVPLKVRGKAAAIIFADSADRGAAAINVEAIELLVNTAGMVVELVSLRARMAEGASAARPAAQAPAAQAPAAQAPAAPTEQAPPARPVEPPAPPPAPPVIAQPAPPAPPAPDRPEPPPPAPDRQFQTFSVPEPAPTAPSFFVPTVEPPPEPRNVPPPPEPSADFWGARPSGSLNAPPVAPRPPEPPPSPARSATDISDEEKAHNDARRFARLLVSEIKLYNEQKVAEGRRNNDLYDRLKEDIDRSRQMYEKRVTPSVAAKFDYFYDELVNTLAEGDAARLGSDHPGPSVAV
ncbi:MAG TPA: hypothetical protein VJ464_03650 [Blastocatellia bacterium]|nr:hypothetical protein [Blastocatellia bacterium]